MARVRDLFEVSYGHSLELNRLARSSAADAMNFVSRTTRNNGVSARVPAIEGLTAAAADTISVALSGNGVLAAFVQPSPYYTGYHVAILTPRRPMGDIEKLWWSRCITANRYRYSYGRQANRTLPDLELPDEMPVWCVDVSVPDFSAMRTPGSNAPTSVLDPTAWKDFRYLDLFVIEHGTFEMKRGLKPGSTPFIGASARRNGITALADIAPTHLGGVITVSKDGSVGEAFYQPRPFFASSNLIVLTPKRPLSAAASLFVCALIRAEKFRFSYGRKWNMERMTQAVMRLPITSEGEPDWTFMERFVAALPYSSSIGG